MKVLSFIIANGLAIVVGDPLLFVALLGRSQIWLVRPEVISRSAPTLRNTASVTWSPPLRNLDYALLLPEIDGLLLAGSQRAHAEKRSATLPHQYPGLRL